MSRRHHPRKRRVEIEPAEARPEREINRILDLLDRIAEGPDRQPLTPEQRRMRKLARIYSVAFIVAAVSVGERWLS